MYVNGELWGSLGVPILFWLKGQKRPLFLKKFKELLTRPVWRKISKDMCLCNKIQKEKLTKNPMVVKFLKNSLLFK